MYSLLFSSVVFFLRCIFSERKKCVRHSNLLHTWKLAQMRGDGECMSSANIFKHFFFFSMTMMNHDESKFFFSCHFDHLSGRKKIKRMRTTKKTNNNTKYLVSDANWMVTRTKAAKKKKEIHCRERMNWKCAFSHQYYFARSDFLRYHYKNIFKNHCVPNNFNNGHRSWESARVRGTSRKMNQPLTIWHGIFGIHWSVVLVWFRHGMVVLTLYLLPYTYMHRETYTMSTHKMSEWRQSDSQCHQSSAV